MSPPSLYKWLDNAGSMYTLTAVMIYYLLYMYLLEKYVLLYLKKRKTNVWMFSIIKGKVGMFEEKVS